MFVGDKKGDANNRHPEREKKLVSMGQRPSRYLTGKRRGAGTVGWKLKLKKEILETSIGKKGEKSREKKSPQNGKPTELKMSSDRET